MAGKQGATGRQPPVPLLEEIADMVPSFGQGHQFFMLLQLGIVRKDMVEGQVAIPDFSTPCALGGPQN
jgi:hypothetical protein